MNDNLTSPIKGEENGPLVPCVHINDMTIEHKYIFFELVILQEQLRLYRNLEITLRTRTLKIE